MRRRILGTMIAAVVGSVLLLAADGPLTPLMNLRGRTDANGYLLTTSGAYSGADGPLTALANLRGRTDANGYLIVTLGAGPMLMGDGTVSAPSYSFASQTNTGFYWAGTTAIGMALNGVNKFAWSNNGYGLSSDMALSWTNGPNSAASTYDTILARDAAGVLALKNSTTAQTFRVYQTTTGSVRAEINAAVAPVTAAASVAAGGTVNLNSDITRTRYQVTISPASGDCATAFNAAALTADCTIATLPAGMKLVGVYADVTAGFTCSGTCSGTKTIGAGVTAGGVTILASGLSVAATGTFGLADADLGTSMVRAAQIQGGYTPSWSATSPVIVRFTSGTGNWGNGAATFVNAGTVKFTLITEQVK